MINIAVKSQEALNSDTLAKSLETNPAFVRKIMAKLSKAGLIKTKRGQAGGVTLLKNPKNISLKDIYLASHEKNNETMSGKNKMRCPVNVSACNILLKLSSQLESTYMLVLSRIKLSHLIKDIHYEK